MSSNSHFVEYGDIFINIDDISFVVFNSSDNDESCGTITIHFKSGNKYKFDSNYEDYEDFKSKVRFSKD